MANLKTPTSDKCLEGYKIQFTKKVFLVVNKMNMKIKYSL